MTLFSDTFFATLLVALYFVHRCFISTLSSRVDISSESGHSSRSQDFVLHFFYSQDFELWHNSATFGQDFELGQSCKFLTGYIVLFWGIECYSFPNLFLENTVSATRSQIYFSKIRFVLP